MGKTIKDSREFKDIVKPDRSTKKKLSLEEKRAIQRLKQDATMEKFAKYGLAG